MTLPTSWLACSACGQQAPIEAMGPCPACTSGVLEVAYAAIRDQDATVLSHSDRAGIWRWSSRPGTTAIVFPGMSCSRR